MTILAAQTTKSWIRWLLELKPIVVISCSFPCRRRRRHCCRLHRRRRRRRRRWPHQTMLQSHPLDRSNSEERLDGKFPGKRRGKNK